jgi:hypothetical protein
MLRKCSHSVMIPNDVEGYESPYCTGCRPAMDRTIMLWKSDHEREHDEMNKESCYVCSSREFQYLTEDEFFCPRCGFDNFTFI